MRHFYTHLRRETDSNTFCTTKNRGMMPMLNSSSRQNQYQSIQPVTINRDLHTMFRLIFQNVSELARKISLSSYKAARLHETPGSGICDQTIQIYPGDKAPPCTCILLAQPGLIMSPKCSRHADPVHPSLLPVHEPAMEDQTSGE